MFKFFYVLLILLITLEWFKVDKESINRHLRASSEIRKESGTKMKFSRHYSDEELIRLPERIIPVRIWIKCIFH